MPELKSPVVEAIESFYKDRQTSWDAPNLSCSSLADPCDRKLWYGFRWASPRNLHTGTRERLFQTGHREEARMLDDLRQIGCAIAEIDPATGKQWRVEFIGGALAGKLDAKGTGVPGAEVIEHVIELKTHNEKSFKEVVKKGVEVAKPEHFVQMQLYMHGTGATRALYVAHNKNTDELHVERIHADPLAAGALLARAERVVTTDNAPERIESFRCKWCQHAEVCLEGAWPRANCRTCLHAERTASNEWRCSSTGGSLSRDDQKKGCRSHLFLPTLVPGQQVDADAEAQTVTYQIADGMWIDGRDPKPVVPEVRP